jgi:hypothetical protein
MDLGELLVVPAFAQDEPIASGKASLAVSAVVEPPIQLAFAMPDEVGSARPAALLTEVSRVDEVAQGSE